MYRPNSLVAVACVWIALGAVWVCAGVPGLFFALTLPAQVRGAGGGVELMERTSSFAAWVVAGMTAEIVAGLMAVVLAVALLQLRSWGRSGLEVMTVLLMIAIAVFLCVYMYSALESGSTALVAGGVVATLLLGPPLWLLRKHLRTRAVYEAIEAATRSRA